MAELDDLGLLPEEEMDAETDLEAAAASALETGVPVEEDPVVPFGRTWVMNWDEGRFVRAGSAPAEVRGSRGLEQWLQMAARAAWTGHAVFDEEFGVDRPDSPVGHVDGDALVEAQDWLRRLTEAWMVHDRIAAIEAEVVLDGDTIVVQGSGGGPFLVQTDEETVAVEPFSVSDLEG